LHLLHIVLDHLKLPLEVILQVLIAGLDGGHAVHGGKVRNSLIVSTHYLAHVVYLLLDRRFVVFNYLTKLLKQFQLSLDHLVIACMEDFHDFIFD
jgi:hypothetical protein